MIGEAATISRIVELLHLPVQHSAEHLREIYSEISGSCGYDNFIRQGDGARLETAEMEGGSASRLTFGRDRIIFQEERGRTGLEHFLRRVEATLSFAAPKLGIPIWVARTITQRAVTQVQGGETAPAFLGRNVFRIEPEHLAPLDRPTQVVGFRMDFPARNAQEGAHRVRIESYLRDPNSLFLEDIGTFKLPVQSRDHERIFTELRDVEQFLGERLRAFLDGLDG